MIIVILSNGKTNVKGCGGAFNRMKTFDIPSAVNPGLFQRYTDDNSGAFIDESAEWDTFISDKDTAREFFLQEHRF